MSIDVKCKVPVYEVNGSDAAADTDKCKLSIESHWNKVYEVNLVINGKSLTVSGCDLIEAVKNAMRKG